MRLRHLVVASLAAASAMATARPASAVTVQLPAVADATLYESALGSLANGSGSRIFAGRTDDGLLRRALIRFNVSSVIPPGSTIESVTLTLLLSRTQAGDETVNMHRVASAWGEGASDDGGQEGDGATPQTDDATWIHTFYPSSFWSNPGGDFTPTISAAQVVGSTLTFYSWSGPGLVADVQAWVNGAAPNHGWILRGNEAANKTSKRFESRTTSNAANRPALTIEFTPPPASGACCLPDGSCLTTTEGQCLALGGVYKGDDFPCTPNPCDQPVGACCLPDGLCATLTQAECEALSGLWQGPATDCVNNPCPLTPFVDPLPIPGVMQPVTGAPGGAAHYEIAIVEAQQQFHRDLGPATVWGYDGTYPAKTIEARSGQTVTVNWINDLRDEQGALRTEHYLPVDTCLHGPDHSGQAPVVVTHLHGGHVAPTSDGYPELTFPPGQSSGVYEYPNNQQAGTLWFHDHALGITRLNVYMGLAGFYLVRDDVEDALNLPAGEFEIPLAIQDRTFNPDGTLWYPPMWMDHFFGEYMVVNGKVNPFHNVKRGKHRFRLLNGCGSRTVTLALSTGTNFTVIGTEGGLLPEPVVVQSITLAPGERSDIVIDFEPFAAGTEIVLTNSAPAPFPGPAGQGVLPNVMKFIVGAELGHTDPIPPALRAVPPIPESESVATRDFELRFDPVDPCGTGQWLINGLAWDDITEEPALGTAEVWRFVNRSAVMHPMHMHLVMFQVIDRQPFQVIGGEIVPIGDPIPAEPVIAGWKDTVQVQPNEIVRVIARFEDYAGQFAYHCHILEHEDHEMMRQFRALPACPGDLNLDRAVTGADLGILLGAWGTADFHADLNADGVVSGADLGLLLGAWGGCPAPPPDFMTDYTAHSRAAP